MEINRLVPLQSPKVLTPVNGTPATVSKAFSEHLTNALDNVNKAQIESSELTKKYAAGQVEDIHQVMVASQKASVMLSLTMQVRNKVIESYQEIMRMQI